MKSELKWKIAVDLAMAALLLSQMAFMLIGEISHEWRGAVLMATGGYGNNKELLNEEMKGALYYDPVSSTGDGVIMAAAEGIDADTRLMEYGKRYPNGIEVSEGIAKSTINGNITGWTMSAILVNTEGKRVVNEKASNRTILEMELEQESQMLYLLMDEETFSVWKTKLGEAW